MRRDEQIQIHILHIIKQYKNTLLISTFMNKRPCRQTRYFKTYIRMFFIKRKIQLENWKRLPIVLVAGNTRKLIGRSYCSLQEKPYTVTV